MKKMGLFVLLLPFLGCQNEPKTPQNTATTEGVFEAKVTPLADTAVANFTVVPQQQVGGITPNMDENDLKLLFGDTNVVRKDRGDVQTIIFPNTMNELEIVWKKGQKFKKIESIIIARPGKWQSAEGIRVGATLAELEKINGKKVELYQKPDDTDVVRWQNGAVNPNLNVMLDHYEAKVIRIQIDF